MRHERGSITKQGIIRELLEDAWQLTYDIKDQTPEPEHIKRARKEHARLGKILDKWATAKDRQVRKRKQKFKTAYYDAKQLFAFGKADDAIRLLKRIKSQKW